MPIMKPTVGRKVWFYRNSDQHSPIDATVIKVFALPGQEQFATPVNLFIIDPESGMTGMESMVTAGDESTMGRHYRWMPYQMSTAAREAGAGLSLQQQVAAVGSRLVTSKPDPATQVLTSSDVGDLGAVLSGATDGPVVITSKDLLRLHAQGDVPPPPSDDQSPL